MMRMGVRVAACAAMFLVTVGAGAGAAALPQTGGGKFEVSFPAAAHSGTITGRVFVVGSTSEQPEPRLQAGGWGDAGPFFGMDVNALAAEQSAVIDASTLGSPVKSLRDIPGGDY